MSMVVCESCKNVVWAYDHETRAIAGICNMLSLPCGICGTIGTFDGWDGEMSWQQMHELAAEWSYTWAPDGQNRWFGARLVEVAAAVTAAPSDAATRLQGLLGEWVAAQEAYYSAVGPEITVAHGRLERAREAARDAVAAGSVAP